MYRVMNISGGQLVCTLADKKTTLRLNNKASENVSEDLMTKHLFNIEKQGLIKLEQTSTDTKQTTKVNTAPTSPVVSEKKEG